MQSYISKMNNDYFLSRRSCRDFKDEAIDLSKIEEIIRKAAKAPTCGNMQLYSVIITSENGGLRKLASLHYNQPAASTAPVILTICADFNRFTRWCEINKANAGYDNFHSFITAMTDAVILAQQIVTVAEIEGLASCYLGTVTYNAKEISDLLQLPDLVVPVASVSLGIANSDGEKTDRLPLKGFVHKEIYQKKTDEDIIEIFKIHDENPSNRQFMEENHKDNLAQVFAEVRYPKEANESLSKNFMDLLKDKGFIKES